MENVTQALVNFGTKLTFDDLPEAGVLAIKRTLLDSIGCALGAYVTPKPEIMLAHINELGGNPQASIIGDGKTSCALASFANAEFINCLDFDSGGPPGGSHNTPFITGPCLAIAERVKASGKDLITALALANEVSSRVGRSIAQFKRLKGEPPYYEFPPALSLSFNIFGGVAGAAKLLDLDEQETAHAYGIAGYSTPAPAERKSRETPGALAWTKYGTWPGWVAKLATEAALLAGRGFIGDTSVLDGEWGFWRFFGSPYFDSNAFLDLGKVWYHADMRQWKRYPCCGLYQGAIEALNQIQTENEIKPEEIEQIVVKGDPGMLMARCANTEIVSYQDTQFTSAYVLAVAAFYGRKPGAYWQAPSTFKDPRILSMMKKIKTALHPQTEEIFATQFKEGKRWAIDMGRVIVEVTARGKKFTMETASGPNTFISMSDDELKQKFKGNASYSCFSPDRVERLIDTIYNLDKVDNIAEIGLTSD